MGVRFYPAAGGGVADHGDLTGLADDDHGQYLRGGQVSKDVSGAADVALTAQEARSGVIFLVGEPTADIAVTVPDAVTGPWLVSDQTTGSYSVTFRPVSGTGVALTRGPAWRVWSDGGSCVGGVLPAGLNADDFALASGVLGLNRAMVTAARAVWRSLEFKVEPGSSSGVKVTLTDMWNGDAVLADDLDKGATVNGVSLDGSGYRVTITASALTGNVLWAGGSLYLNNSGTALFTGVTFTGGAALVNHNLADGSGGAYDLTTLAAGKQVRTALVYLTDA
jgi:hypothetical protein